MISNACTRIDIGTSAGSAPPRAYPSLIWGVSDEVIQVSITSRSPTNSSCPQDGHCGAGWSAFVNMLEYKARLHGRAFRRIGRFEPTSQVCSACGVKDGPKPLHVRAWQCRGCGVWLDRDVNAAVNVARAAGLAVSACGAQVRPGVIPAQRGEAGTLPGAA
jgi:ribosomal protein L37AE/L43A